MSFEEMDKEISKSIQERLKFKHSPKRDKKVFKLIQERDEQSDPYMRDFLVLELLAIAKKWRAKALMREQVIKESDTALLETCELVLDSFQHTMKNVARIIRDKPTIFNPDAIDLMDSMKILKQAVDKYGRKQQKEPLKLYRCKNGHEIETNKEPQPPGTKYTCMMCYEENSSTWYMEEVKE